MTDFSSFSNLSFDEIKWIDNILLEKTDEESFDSFLASLIMKLHVVSQEYTDQLEEGLPSFSLLFLSLLNTFFD